MPKIGAGLLSPTGQWHPVRFMRHQDEGERLFHELHPTEAEAARKNVGYVNGLALLCKKGWVRIGENGHITNEDWDLIPQDKLTQAQLDVIWELFAAAKQQEPKTAWLNDYLDGLRESLDIDPYTEE